MLENKASIKDCLNRGSVNYGRYMYSLLNRDARCSMNDLKNLIKGGAYILTYTQPMYDKSNHRYLPDNFRYTEPEVRNVRFGGFVSEPYVCAVCGRTATNVGRFLDVDSFEEFAISRGCLAHPSTVLWGAGTPKDKIAAWYSSRELQDGVDRGDTLAKLALFFRDLED